MNATWLIPLPVLLPLIGAALTLVVRRSVPAQRIISIVALSASTAVTAVLIPITDRHGPQTIWLGSWDGLGIALVADRLSALMLLVSSIVTLLVLIFSIGQGVADSGRNTPLSIYFPTFLVLSAGVANAFLAGDLFNLFVGFEILLFASYVLLTLGGTAARIQAGTSYIVVSLVSSLLFLVGIAAVYGATGTVNFAQLAQRLGDISPGASLTIQLLLLTAFGIKAAVFPMSAWLPNSYPTAPAPVTAVFAGLLTKVGVYAIIRTQTLLFGDSQLYGLLMWVALLTMVVGILGAVAQSGIKRMLSFTLISHIGYMIFGVALGTQAGLSGATFYVVHHITIQTSLFLVTGLIERVGGSTSLDRLGGLALVSPVLGVLFFLPAMNLGGIPPLSGFMAKTGLLQAGMAYGGWLAYLLVAGALATSLLTLYAVSKAWSQAFWRTPNEAMLSSVTRAPDLDTDRMLGVDDGVADRESSVRILAPDDVEQDHESTGDKAMPFTMVAATAAVILVSVAITVFAGPLYEFTDRAARDMLLQTPYIESVLVGSTP